VVDTIDVGDHPGGIALTPNGDFAYVTNKFDETVSDIRTSDNTVIATIDEDAFDDPKGVAPGSTGQYVYVTNEDGYDVTLIQVSDNTVVDDIYLDDYAY
jgi:DNA-binding beta-propeller fold protein YncE